MTDPNPTPEEALASIQEARGAVGRDMDYPFGWDLYYGAVLAALVSAQGLPQPWSALVLVAALCALAVMVRLWRDRTGWWVNGYGPRRARWVAFGLAVVLLALMTLTMWTKFGDGPAWGPWVAGGLAFIAGIAGGRLWMAVYRREMKGPVR